MDIYFYSLNLAVSPQRTGSSLEFPRQKDTSIITTPCTFCFQYVCRWNSKLCLFLFSFSSPSDKGYGNHCLVNMMVARQ